MKLKTYYVLGIDQDKKWVVEDVNDWKLCQQELKTNDFDQPMPPWEDPYQG